ncbi:MAG: acyl-CoA dehydrogenase family protein [Desulfobacterales bacterium]|nr:acyl-CoA dehydrogenase family protein [Desulfobacterales bacterium]
MRPYADEWDAKHHFPYKEAIKPMGELGFFGTVIPEEYGGEGMGFLAAMIITEEIARASSSLRVQVNMHDAGLRLHHLQIRQRGAAQEDTSPSW